MKGAIVLNIDDKKLNKTFIDLKSKNNSHSFEELYKLANKIVYGVAFSILKNKEDSEDVVDDIDLYDEPISLFEEDFEEPYVDETVFNEEVEPLSEYENTKTVKKESEDIEDLIDDTFEFDTLDKKKKD